MKTILKSESNKEIEVNLKREANLKIKTILFSTEKKIVLNGFDHWSGENTLKKELH